MRLDLTSKQLADISHCLDMFAIYLRRAGKTERAAEVDSLRDCLLLALLYMEEVKS